MISHLLLQKQTDGRFLLTMRGVYTAGIEEAFLAFARETGGVWNGVRSGDVGYYYAAVQLGPLASKARERKIVLVPADPITQRALGPIATEGPGVLAKRDAAREEVVRAFSRELARQEKNRDEHGTPRQLYPFQRVGAFFLSQRPGALLSDEPGLGKTGQTLSAVPQGAPLLVVAPVVARGVWAREMAAWRPGEFRMDVLSGMGSFRWPEPGEMVVTSYEILDLPDEPEIAGQLHPNTVIVADEAHNLKNRKALRTSRFVEVASAARQKGGRVWLLTATPLLNEPTELYTLLRIAGLDRQVFGSYVGFVESFGGYKINIPYKGGGGKTREIQKFRGPSQDVPAKLRKVMLRREKKDVLSELPPKRWTTLEVDLERDGIEAADELEEALAKAGIDLATIVAAGIESAKHAGRIPFEMMSRLRERLARAKVPAMVSEIAKAEQANEPIIVFSAHRIPVEVAGSRPGWAQITGDVKPEFRTRIEDAFQQGKLRGVACSIKAGGVAITLTRASRAIFVDREWTPALNEQAEDRIHRVGQRREVEICLLVGKHKIERRVAQLLAEKTRMIEATLRKSEGA